MADPNIPVYVPIAGRPANTITAGELLAAARALRKSNKDSAARQVTIAAENAVLPVVYGQHPIGGMLAGRIVYGNALYLRIIWCHGECEQIVKVWMNGEELPGGVTRNDYLGTQSQTVDTLLQYAYAQNGITYNDTLPGVCYSTFRVPPALSDGFPEFVADIKGLKLKPTANGTPAWSDCPALAVADFRENTVYGMGLPVNWTDVATLKTKNDEIVGGEKRRTLNIALMDEQYVDDWLDTLCAHAGAWKNDDGGVLRLAPRYQAGSPVMTFDTSNIEAGSLKLGKSGPRDQPTVVRCTYTDVSTTPATDGTANAYAEGVQAGIVDWREAPLPMSGINRYSQADREAVEFLNAITLSDLKGSVRVYDIALKLQLGDPIAITHPVGLTSKAFWITDITATSAGRYTLSFTEYDAAITSNRVVSSPSTPDSGLPISGTPPTLSGLAATEEVYRTGDGLISSRLRISWTDAAWPNTLNTLITISDGVTLVHSGVAWSTSYVSPALQEGRTYTIAAMLISKAGVSGVAAQTAVAMVGKVGTLPGNVPTFEATEAGGKVYARWGAATDLDTLDYEIRYGAVGVSWDNATYVQRIAALAYTIEGLPPGTWDFLIKARDSYKQYSATEAERTVTVTLDNTAAQLGSKTFATPTLVQMAAYAIAGLPYWTTDNGDTWNYGYTGANWNSDSRGSNVWEVPTSSTGSSWTSEAWDLGSTLAATVSTNLAPTAHAGSATVEIGYSASSSNPALATWVPGTSAKVVARYVFVRASIGTGNAMTIVGPITATATGALRRESGAVTTSASTGALVQLASAYAQMKAIQLTAQSAVPMQPVYDRVLTAPEFGLQFQLTVTGGGNSYVYHRISTAVRVIASGDYLEWDVWVSPTSADVAGTNMIGGVEIDFADASTGRGLSVTDTAGVLAVNYSAAANGAAGQWVHRKASLAAAVGKTTASWDLVCESNTAGSHIAVYKNLKVTDGSGTARLDVWAGGEPAANVTAYSALVSNVQAGPANSFLAYCFDGSNAQVAKPLSYTFEGA